MADLKPFLESTPYFTRLPGENHNGATIIPKLLKDPYAELASVLAHEVRNPLTNINLSIELIESVVKDNDLKIYIDIIKRSSLRINDLINELLKYQLAIQVQSEKHSIHQLLDEVLAMAADRITLKNIVITKEYDQEDCKIVMNRAEIKIALTNIIINAIDAMETGNGELKILTKSLDDKCVIQIIDNGCGISKEKLKSIFKPFFTDKPGGMGIGLSTTNDVLRANHVEVEVKSIEDEGTSFILSFEKIFPFSAFIK